MNTFDIIAILAILALAILYWTTRQKLKKLDEVKIKLVEYLRDTPDDDYTVRRTFEQLINSLVIMNSNKDLKIESMQGIIKEGKKENEQFLLEILNLKRDISARSNITRDHLSQIESLAKSVEYHKSLAGASNVLHPQNQDVNGILATYESFAQSADISEGKVRMNAKDLIKEEYIKVIRELHKIGLFPKNYEVDLNFDPKSLAVTIDLISYDEEGDPISFKSWSDFLMEREHFINTITDYVEAVINQKKINQAVDLALNGTEVASV